MKELTLTTETFFENLSKLIASGVTFKASENETKDLIKITFTGGY